MRSQPTSRRAVLTTTSTLALCLPAGWVPVLAARTTTPTTAAPPRNRAPLAPQPFYLLPTGAIRPAGWLDRQLRIQAASLGGRLDETWPDVGPNSGWLGGTGESWERGPYWLDGLVPLAWQLDDPALKAKAQRFIDWTLDHPWPSGMIGPSGNDDWWPRMVMLKALTQYHELTADPRVVPVMTRYFHYQLAALPDRPLKDWGRFRWQDEVVSVIWLYNRTGDAKLIELAALLKRQGFDWQALFADYPYRTKTVAADIGLDRPDRPGEVPNGLKDPALAVHGVNNAQGIKASPVWSLVSGSDEDRRAVHHHLATLDRYHGQPTGIFAADEHLAGRGPSQGVETCTVVEALYSLELAMAITGDAAIGDRIEKIAYNALPAAFTDDMWAHQYDQQPNQIRCSLTKGPWTTNGPESNLFGLEPHFGCCTANFHQGWPKLTASLWMATGDDGLAAMVYAPCEVATQVRGVPVRLVEETDYPFRERVALRIEPARAVRFPLKLRVPGWAATHGVRVNGAEAAARVEAGFATIDREWRAGDRVEIGFTSEPRQEAGPGGEVSIAQGPLVFSLPVEEQWRKWRQRGLTADWQVAPGGRWAYAIDPGAPLRRIERPVGPVPFARRTPAVVLTAAGYPVDGWGEALGAAVQPPTDPKRAGPATRLVLMPYGAPKLRVTAFPVAKG